MGADFDNGMDDEARTEVVLDFSGGMVSNARPDLLGANQYALAQNCFPREGLRLTTRPGYEVKGSSGLASAQGLFFMSLGTGYQRIVAVENTVVKLWDGAAWTTASHTPANATIALAQNGELLWLADGTARLYTFDGTTWTARDNSAPAAGGPTAGATILCSAANRLLASGYSAAPDTIEVGPILSIGTWNATTDSLRIGGDGESIVAVVPMPDHIAAVLKKNSVWLINMSPALGPLVADFSIRALSRGAGCVGPRAWARSGDDLHIWSQEGVLAVSRMIADGGSFVTGDPLSLPIQNYVERVNPDHLDKITAHAYGRHIFWSVPLDDATTCDTVLVWDVRLKQWVAIFTGWNSARFITAQWNLQVPTLAWMRTNGELAVWMDRADTQLSATYLDNGAAFTTLITLRGMPFSDGLVTKNGNNCEFRFRNSLAQSVTLRSLYDEAVTKTITRDVRQQGVSFPLTFPITFGYVAPVDWRHPLPMSPRFRQLQLQVETTGMVEFYEARATAWANPQDS